MSHHTTPLIDFYRGEATDHQGRYIDAIWALSPFWLEHTHDYIQWLFPIPEVGRFNGFAPPLTVIERMPLKTIARYVNASERRWM